MDQEVVLIDVSNLEDCRDKKNYEALKEIFADARQQIDQGREIVLQMTFIDSPPELMERIQSRERLEEIFKYYLPESAI